MKTQNVNKLEFSTSTISELNNNKLKEIKGGTHTSLPSDIRCTFLVTSSGGTNYTIRK
ncbi:bacteriocin [Lacinutrix neustonica]|uniref:Bacteriocin n=1 Tax=Lacinutrix neustonica TaxID=2980107 RepID=A0A9E8SDA9_9FLAO|nr:bacteriocin [Lacinutrix neustonica]WAC01024.1 bacteriocin [Lacinutrix neustonica]